MKKNELLKEWLRRAKSNLERAKIGKNKIEDILYEDLCFDCQQCVEKSLKALLIFYDISFPRTHSINLLLSLLENQIKNIPIHITDNVILNDYAVETRYPGFYEPVSEEEYKNSLELAKKTFDWVNSIIKKN